MFAYVLEPRAQRDALREETLKRIAALQTLSETVATTLLEAPHAHSHARTLGAVAILSRNVCGLLAASVKPGP